MTSALELAAQLIRNRCVNDGTPDSGHEVRSVETLADYFGSAGTVIEPHPGRQSVVYRVAGRDPEAPALMLMGHLDVVPVNEETWTCDPFGGEIRDGFLWGRGAIDMLNVTAGMASAFRPYLTGEREAPAGDLVFFGVADEENGGGLGASYIKEHQPELVSCEYLLTEIALPSIPTREGPALPVTVAEKGPSWRILRTSGTPGHGSQPYGTNNALVPLARAMAALADNPSPAAITDEWTAFVVGLKLDPGLTNRLLDVDQIDAAIEEVAGGDMGFARWAHACTHLTISPTILHAGTKANIIPDAALAEVDVRKLPGQDEASVDDHFRKVLGPDLYDEIDVEVKPPYPATGSEPRGPLWEAIADSAEALSGSRSLLPCLIPVATDARFFRTDGVVAYGVGMFDDALSFGDVLSLFHGNDERVSEGSVELTAKLLAGIVEAFAARTSQ